MKTYVLPRESIAEFSRGGEAKPLKMILTNLQTSLKENHNLEFQ